MSAASRLVRLRLLHSARGWHTRRIRTRCPRWTTPRRRFAPLEPAAPVPPVVLLDPSQKRARLPVGPVRAQRRLALLGEVGWNGIAGFGPNLTFRLHPNVSLDLGAGISLVGWKVGFARSLPAAQGAVTPFIGVGIMPAGGFGSEPIEIQPQRR